MASEAAKLRLAQATIRLSRAALGGNDPEAGKEFGLALFDCDGDFEGAIELVRPPPRNGR